MIVCVSILYSLLMLFYLFQMRKRLLMNAAVIFVVAQATMFYGSLSILDTHIEADVVHLWVMLFSFALFIIGVQLACITWPERANMTLKDWYMASKGITVEDTLLFNFGMTVIIGISLLVGVLYYNAVGYNVFIMAISSFLNGTGPINNIATLRLNSYSGENYYYAGYVNQFKNVLFPLSLIYLFTRNRLTAKKTNYFLLLVLVPICMVFLLGTGQRGAFMIMAIVVIVFLMSVGARKGSIKINKNVIFATAVIFGLATLFLGRGTNEINSLTDIWILLKHMLQRFTTDNQISSVIGFRYIYDQPVQYGREWLNSIISLLPGIRNPVPLASEIFYLMFGTTRGTAPPSIWGSVWYNFGWIGIATIPFIMGFLYQALYIRFMAGKRGLFRILIYSVMVVLLGLWRAGGPDSLANTGLVTVILFGLIMGKLSMIKIRGIRSTGGHIRRQIFSQG